MGDTEVIALMKRFVRASEISATLERAERGTMTREGCDRAVIDAIGLLQGQKYNDIIAQLRKWAETERDTLRTVIGKTIAAMQGNTDVR